MPGQLIIVSNRLPVTVTKTDGVLSFTPSNGGLATAIASLPKHRDRIWIGWPGIASDELTTSDKRLITRELNKLGCIPIHLTQQQISQYYDGYANGTLWPLFHYLPGYSVHRDDYWNAYRKVAEVFNRTIQKVAQPDATIWIHDYHLLTLPRLLRKGLPKVGIGFFLHIPFPSYEIFRQLPQRKELLNGLLGADLIGFHIYDSAVHFSHSVQRLLGFNSTLNRIVLKDRVVQTDAFPIGINYDLFAKAGRDPLVKAEISRLRKSFKNTKLILSMDRLDYSKGIPNRLEAYEKFLERNPLYHNKVALAMVAVPSRIDIPAYQQLKLEVEQIVSRINGRFGTVDWTPISYQYKNLPFEQIAALYSEAKAALITPLRDGMNLVAKEYLAAKQASPGVLILSEMAGAADELPEAMRVNPNDQAAVARAIEKALAMPLVQQKRSLRIMQSRLCRYNVGRWADDFLHELDFAKRHRATQAVPVLNRKDREQLILAATSAKRRLILLDYDGTLANFVSTPDPAAARPTPKLRRILQQLARQPGTDIAIISGRTRDALESWFGDMPIILSAEHGAWLKNSQTWESSGIADTSWKSAVLPVLLVMAERTPGSGVEAKDFALVWHYSNVTPDLAYIRNEQLRHELANVLPSREIKLYDGRKIIEIKHEQVTKGAVVKRLQTNQAYDFILAIGDDYTDEDMFAALPATAYTGKVGPGPSQARFQLPSVETVVKLLADLSKI